MSPIVVAGTRSGRRKRKLERGACVSQNPALRNLHLARHAEEDLERHTAHVARTLNRTCSAACSNDLRFHNDSGRGTRACLGDPSSPCRSFSGMMLQDYLSHDGLVVVVLPRKKPPVKPGGQVSRVDRRCSRARSTDLENGRTDIGAVPARSEPRPAS
jgi:hypothetical protein